MKYFRKVISASLSPNTETEDVAAAFTALFSPWRWQQGSDVKAVKQWFAGHFPTKHVTLYNSGRSALYAILRAFTIGKGDEVIVQAFTCVAVPNSVLWAGATPIYTDIDGTYNLDPVDVEKHITVRTKAIIVQHTFGIPANMDVLVNLTKKHNILLIEDCAHALGALYKGKRVGSFGDAAFFSFGRDKVLSSVWGGAAIIHNDCRVADAAAKIHTFHNRLPMPGVSWIVQQLLHPLAFAFIIPWYNLGVGKLLLVLLQRINLLSFPVYLEEKSGGRPQGFPAQYPNALAKLLRVQLRKLDRFVGQRREVAQIYAKKFSGLPHNLPYIPGSGYLRYPVWVDDPEQLRFRAKKRGVLLGNWYHNVIDPTGVMFDKVDYVLGSCPVSEEAAKHVLNLPTRITIRESSQILVLFRTI